MRTTKAAALLLLALMVPLAAAGAQGQKHALLIGIGDYTYAVPDLEGPPYDLQALQRSLTERWGFPAGNVRCCSTGRRPAPTSWAPSTPWHEPRSPRTSSSSTSAAMAPAAPSAATSASTATREP